MAGRFFRPGPVNITGLIEQLDNLYSRRCSVCGGYHSLPDLATGNDDWNKLLERISKELYDEKLNKGFIDAEIYNRTADTLLKAIHEGLGGVNFAYDDERNILKAYLEQNIYKFSAAKSLAELEEFRAMMLNSDGTITDFITFRNRVAQAGYKFNETYLKTEYDTAYQSALMAHKWQVLSSTSDYLEYTTAHDDRVRPEHAALDGLTLPVNSPVWNTIWPPVDWNCRCTVVPGVADNIKYTDAQAGRLGDFIEPYFRNNSGKTKTIYKDDHPYFIDANLKEHQLDAVKNYGLRTPEQIFASVSKLPEIKGLESAKDYKQWWLEQFGEAPAIVTDAVNNNVLFTEEFKNHLLENTSEKRFSYAANFTNVLKMPDEIWTSIKNGKLANLYIKYYTDGAYVLVVKDQNNKLNGTTFYKLTEKRLKELRRGILRYSK